ncbi:MAG: hypothetical protein GY810_26340 [Aureispira sp.]|nr:hypothetical protein [Aureispira sp.]
MDLNKLYTERVKQFGEKVKQLDKTVLYISLLRVSLFLLICFAVYKCTIVGFQGFWMITLLVSTVAFFAFIAIHQKYIIQKKLHHALLDINKKEKAYIETQALLYDGGADFDDPLHDYVSDLDIYGTHSIFASVNRTSTNIGYQKLGELFKSPLDNIDQIKAQQAAVAELSDQVDWRQEFMAWGMIQPEENKVVERFEKWIDEPEQVIDKPVWKILRIVMPILAIGAVSFWAITGFYQLLILLVVINMGILKTKIQYINIQHELIGKRQKELKKYSILLALILEHKEPQAALLKELQESAKAASVAFKQLTQIANAFDQRLNIFVVVMLNLTGLYDVHCVWALEKWKVKHKKDVLGWLSTLGQYDVLQSLSNYYHNHPSFVFPTVKKTDELIVKATALAHPLIKPTVRIANDVDLGKDADMYIITGSNMSGKSTFLRSVAINALMARCGMPVCATQFECSLMDIMTSIRVRDSVAENVSYFQAELIRLQHLIEKLERGLPAFIILDEVLKGTNSEDKLLGSQLLVRKFLNYHCIGMIATHDLDLGRVEADRSDRVKNLCFESRIEDDELIFDYTLNEGIAKNKNATFLMRKMNIVS